MIPVKAITKNTAKRSCPFENIALIFYEIRKNNSNPFGFKIMLGLKFRLYGFAEFLAVCKTFNTIV